MNQDENIHVSFVIPTFNKAPFLDRFLANVREFKQPDDELIIIDGGSTDQTPAVIKRHNDIVTVFVSEKDRGPTHALNKGFLKARGRIIMNLTDDDYLYPDAVRRAIKTMDEHPELDALIVGGGIYRKDDATGKETLVYYQYLPEGKTLDPVTILHYLPCGFMLINRRILSLTGIFDASIQASDTYFTSQLLRSGVNFKYINVKMFKIYHHSHSQSIVNLATTRRDIIAVLARHGRWAEVFRIPCSEAGNAFHLNFSEAVTFKDKIVIAYLKLCLAFISLPLWSLGFWWRLATYLKAKSRARGDEPRWDGSLR
jgi:glycosyltransferase involved in cell wall biosynthesis